MILQPYLTKSQQHKMIEKGRVGIGEHLISSAVNMWMHMQSNQSNQSNLTYLPFYFPTTSLAIRYSANHKSFSNLSFPRPINLILIQLIVEVKIF